MTSTFPRSLHSCGTWRSGTWTQVSDSWRFSCCSIQDLGSDRLATSWCGLGFFIGLRQARRLNDSERCVQKGSVSTAERDSPNMLWKIVEVVISNIYIYMCVCYMPTQAVYGCISDLWSWVCSTEYPSWLSFLWFQERRFGPLEIIGRSQSRAAAESRSGQVARDRHTLIILKLCLHVSYPMHSYKLLWLLSRNCFFFVCLSCLKYPAVFTIFVCHMCMLKHDKFHGTMYKMSNWSIISSYPNEMLHALSGYKFPTLEFEFESSLACMVRLRMSHWSPSRIFCRILTPGAMCAMWKYDKQICWCSSRYKACNFLCLGQAC